MPSVGGTMAKNAAFGSFDVGFIEKLVDAGQTFNVVYDIGASNGGWSHVISEVLPNAKFELFEPFDSPQYADTWSVNRQRHPDFRMHRVALGAKDDTLLLNVYEGHEGNSLIDSDWEGIKEKRPVPVRQLDGYVAKNGLYPPDLIKMDTQGFELKILKGGENCCRTAKLLMLETWLYRGYGQETPLLHEVIAWLDEHNFRLVTLWDVYADAGLKLQAIDAFFLRNDIAETLGNQGFQLGSL